MGNEAVDVREQRGLAIAQSKGKRIRHIAGETYLVPSRSEGSGGYVVSLSENTCTCPDFETTGLRCKHQWAVRIVRREVPMPNVDGVAVKEHRITYGQDWPAYNRAQCEEKSCVQSLLRGLCDGIKQEPQKTGRPRIPLGDVVYGATMKVYTTFSGRRATTDIEDCADRGLIEHAPSYNSLFRYVERADLLPLLTMLVEESATPLRAIERNFAVDATGFTTNTYGRWFDHKYGREMKVHRWIKAHAMVGTLTNIVTAVKVTESYENDSPHLKALLVATAANEFQMAEVSGDKAYLSNENLLAIEGVGAAAYIPFKSNSTPTGNTEAWQRLFHYFSLQKTEFLSHYHQRSNVETTFSAIKRKFGAAVRSKLTPAQYNEVLLKCLCHNLSVLVHSIHELGIEPKFWLPRKADR